MGEHLEKDVLSGTPCPRCSCYLVRHFECFCGEVHSDYCLNCHRWTTLALSEYAELSEYDEVCRMGPVAHVHTEEARVERLRAQIDMVKRYMVLFKWRDASTDRYGEDLVALLSSLGEGVPDPRLPLELVPAWYAFGKLDEDRRWNYAKAYVRETEAR